MPFRSPIRSVAVKGSSGTIVNTTMTGAVSPVYAVPSGATLLYFSATHTIPSPADPFVNTGGGDTLDNRIKYAGQGFYPRSTVKQPIVEWGLWDGTTFTVTANAVIWTDRCSGFQTPPAYATSGAGFVKSSGLTVAGPYFRVRWNAGNPAPAGTIWKLRVEVVPASTTINGQTGGISYPPGTLIDITDARMTQSGATWMAIAVGTTLDANGASTGSARPFCRSSNPNNGRSYIIGYYDSSSDSGGYSTFTAGSLATNYNITGDVLLVSYDGLGAGEKISLGFA